MAQTLIAARVDVRTKKSVEAACAVRGLKMQRFIEEALLDKLDELEDIEEIKQLRSEATTPLTKVLKKLKLDGKI